VKKSQAGGGVAVKIEHAVYQSAKMFGRHFDDKDELLSHITRQSIDVLKVNNFVSLVIFTISILELDFFQSRRIK
jgi:translation initiation factor 5B